MDKRSILLITLDSCRFDSFEAANAPNMKSVGALNCAAAPGTFTYTSHAAMFMGFMPGVAGRHERFVNSKYAKIFKLKGAGAGKSPADPAMNLRGRNVINGLRMLGYHAFGSGAVGWFNPRVPTSAHLIGEFEDFFFPGDKISIDRQLGFLQSRIKSTADPVFAFLNVGETHVPYVHKEAPWNKEWNPCEPFGSNNDADECRRRQIACIEFVDVMLGSILEEFSNSTIIVCADHGDCWGEDGLWEHGIYHPKVLEVPLMMRVNEDALHQMEQSVARAPIKVTSGEGN